MKNILFAITLFFTSTVLFAQTTVSGSVTDARTGDPLPGTNVTIVGENLGTTTDFDGNFSLTVSKSAPFTLEASSVGFSSSTVEVTKNGQVINFKLSEDTEVLDEVVVSASRSPERIRESPVTIERMGVRAIQNTTAATFYDGLENLKGVDINTNSLTFKSVNTRGFATFSNTRFMQLVDGMDNTSPALNFALGNLLGMNELDVNSVEILPGASSALYGANAYNGILFMTSKSPFKHTGISTYFKTGLTMQDAAGDNQFYDWGIRAAYKFSDKWAGKANFSYLKGTDWWATDYNQYSSEGVAIGEPNTITPFANRGYAHDAVNIYGDEIKTDINGVAHSMEAAGLIPVGSSALIPNDIVGRTGYKERDLTDYEAKSIRADFALHYKPWGNDKEIILQHRRGRGNTIYQGSNRYYIKDFTMKQTKLEFKGDNFFVRAYHTTEDAGDSYDMRFTGINMNKANSSQWFGTYVGAYLQGASDIMTAVLTGGGSMADAQAAVQGASPQLHAGSRAYSDATVTLQPGTPEFDAAFNATINDPDLLTGSKFEDESAVNHVDVNYNFKELLNNWADLQVGGSYRLYSLNSKGTIFTDYDGAIDYNEYGSYMQISKKFADDRLKFTGSARYDKAQNFDGNVSPRIALVYSAGENKNHNFRVSFQTGFRNPTTQDQYIGLDAGQAILVGSAPDNLNRYTSKPLDVSAGGQFLMGYAGVGSTVELSGNAAYSNAFSYSSLLDFQATVAAAVPGIMADTGMSQADATAFAAVTNRNVLKKAEVEYVRPEGISVYELGYRGKLGSINLDLNGYYNQYEGFISTQTVIAPYYGNADMTSTAPEDVHPSPAVIDPTTGDHLQTSFLAVTNGDLQPFQVYTNSKSEISSYGGTLGLSSKIFDKFRLGMNYTYAKFDFDQATDPDYEAGFNTPEHKVKASLGATNLFENFGFNVNYRWSDEFLWQSSLVDAIVPARSVVDVQLNYKVPNFKSMFKVGAANLGGDNYMSAPGSGFIGSQYYISWTVNP